MTAVEGSTSNVDNSDGVGGFTMYDTGTRMVFVMEQIAAVEVCI